MICNWISVLVSFLTGLGLGTIVSTMIRRNFEQKKLIFEVKLLKYSNLIAAYQDVVADSSEAARQKYVSAQQQVALIADSKIVQLSKEFFYKKEEEHVTLMNALLEAMRKDLDISG